jgi:hypothetical protein
LLYKTNIMANHYEVLYYLVYENNSKLSQGTTLIMESDSHSEAERKIRQTNNLTPNVKEIQIIKITKK